MTHPAITAKRRYHQMTVTRSKYQRRVRFVLDLTTNSGPIAKLAEKCNFTKTELKRLHIESMHLHEAFTIRPGQAQNHAEELAGLPEKAKKLWDAVRQKVSLSDMTENALSTLEQTPPQKSLDTIVLEIYPTSLVLDNMGADAEIALYNKLMEGVLALDFSDFPSPLSCSIRYEPGDIDDFSNPHWAVEATGLTSRATANIVVERIRALRDKILEDGGCRSDSLPMHLSVYGPEGADWSYNF